MKCLTLFLCLIVMNVMSSVQAQEKKLAACPSSPNCVSSQAADSDHFIAPYRIRGNAEAAWSALKKILVAQKRTVITQETNDYLHAEATSLVFRFVDDIDAILDKDASVIHIRSASRIGYGDFGVNRKRMEMLRQLLKQQGVVE